VVTQPLDRLETVELAPFRAAAAAGLASMMTAHVVYTALDARLPATLSAKACTALRDSVGFNGMLVSDDLEMQAIAARWGIEDAAVQAVAAGCDALLVCWTDEKQERAVDALVREAERSPAFRARCDAALARVREARGRVAAKPAIDDAELDAVIGGADSRAVADAIAARMG
jgi:beta-N-acetylhexosaminidase